MADQDWEPHETPKEAVTRLGGTCGIILGIGIIALVAAVVLINVFVEVAELFESK